MTEHKGTRNITGGDSKDQGALSVPDGSLQPGQVLQSRYRILGIIGLGGMGAVYQARDLNFPNVTRLCAVKEMINLAQDPQLREQTIRNFEREAEILATLSHPAIPQIYDFFSFGDRAYLVMEYIQGRDLEAILNSTDKFLPVEQVLEWGIEVCDVLHYLHTHEPPVVFRDMKPSNIMIDHHKHIRLIDFGIAKQFTIGQPGTMIGTEGYSPPEQYRGISSPSGDLYALGATLHHLLTRRDPRLEPPFSFDQRPIQQFNPNVPEGLITVVTRALGYDHNQRYASAEAMKQSLEAVKLASARAMVLPDSPPAAAMPSAQPSPAAAAPAQYQPVAPVQAPYVAAPAPVAGGPVSTVSPLWKFKVEDAVRSTPVVHENMVIFGSYDNNLWAIDIETHQMRWKMTTEDGIGSSPAIGGAMVYTGSSDGRLYSVDVRTGKRNWNFKTEDKMFSSPHVALGMVFFGSDDGNLYAVKPSQTRAQEIWKYNAAFQIRSSPVVVDEQVFFGTDGGDFYCVDATNGSFAWRFQTRRPIMVKPLILEGIVYVGSNDWHVYALDQGQGFTVWRYRTKGPVISSAAYGKGKVFIGSGDGVLYAFDALSGRIAWTFETGKAIISSPAVLGDSVYFGSNDGGVYSIHAGTGDMLWRFQTDGPIFSSPCVHNNIVYIGSDDQNIYAFQA